MVIRTYAWFLILAPELPLAKLASYFGVIPPGNPLYPNAFAVYLGMVSMFLPFVALPLYSSVETAGLGAGGGGPGFVCLQGEGLYAGHFASNAAGTIGGRHPDFCAGHGDVCRAGSARRGEIYAGGKSHSAAIRCQPGLAFRCGHQHGLDGSDDDQSSALPAQKQGY